jgi:hypothetical protein
VIGESCYLLAALSPALASSAFQLSLTTALASLVTATVNTAIAAFPSPGDHREDGFP